MSHEISILVVDDDELDRLAVRRALKASGLDVHVAEAEDNASALKSLSTMPIDCILLDYRLPGTDGLAVLRTVRSTGIKIPIIMMTGQGDEQLAVEIMKAGATDYLNKGKMSSETLVKSVRAALRVHKAEAMVHSAEEQRRRAETALHHSERLLAITLRSIGDGVVATSADGLVSFINIAGQELTGWSADDAIGQDFANVVPLVSATGTSTESSPVEQVLRVGIGIEFDNQAQAIARSGQRFPISGSCAPIRDEQSAVVGVVFVFRDITERVRNEQRLQLLAETSQLLVSSFDYQENLIGLANLATPDFADWCSIDVVYNGTTVRRLVRALSTALRAITGIEEQQELELDSHAAQGPALVIRSGQTMFYPAIDEHILCDLSADQQQLNKLGLLHQLLCVPLIVRGGTLGAICFGRAAMSKAFDDDDVAFAEELARRAALAVDNALLYREAQEAIKARDTFLSIAAHELKTPLTSLLGYADLIKRRTQAGQPIGEREQRGLAVVVDQARRLNRMVTSLLDLSRIQTGQLSIDQRPVDLSELARRISEEVSPTLMMHTLQYDVPETPVIMIGDELRLEQVLQNLMQNAAKYSPHGSTIRLRMDVLNGWACLSVADEGLGIPSEALPRIFNRFYRAPNAAQQVSGMGVGLFVVRQIVEMHGGRIEVESIEGQGSTFFVWLPLQEAA
jgi:PAS domain S-box-containing protein